MVSTLIRFSVCVWVDTLIKLICDNKSFVHLVQCGGGGLMVKVYTYVYVLYFYLVDFRLLFSFNFIDLSFMHPAVTPEFPLVD